MTREVVEGRPILRRMPGEAKLNPGFASLRAHDVHQGLQSADVDRSSGLVGQELEVTQLIGMAAALATAVKGLDVLDGADLKKVANHQFDIPTFAFDRVVAVLEEVEYVRNVKRDSGKRITQLFETVPEDFTRLYATLDEAFSAREPGEIEMGLIVSIDTLSHGPRPISELDVDPEARERLIALGGAAEAIRVVSVADRQIAYSPYFAYENPELVGEALTKLDIEAVQSAFQSVRARQGSPVLAGPSGETLNALIASGLMAGPAVADPKGHLTAFAIAPYGLPPDLLTIRKPIMDKAMAILAGVRMGETAGGVTSLRQPGAVLHALLQPGRVVARHSSTTRQYSVLRQLGIVTFEGEGDRRGMRLIDSQDNREAVGIAIDLLAYGEAMASKEGTAKLIAPDASGNYRSPIQSIRPARRRSEMPLKTLGTLIETAMGRRAID